MDRRVAAAKCLFDIQDHGFINNFVYLYGENPDPRPKTIKICRNPTKEETDAIEWIYMNKLVVGEIANEESLVSFKLIYSTEDILIPKIQDTLNFYCKLDNV